MTVDGKDLKVDGKVIGQLGDTVEVKDNELYVNGKATGIKVGNMPSWKMMLTVCTPSHCPMPTVK